MEAGKLTIEEEIERRANALAKWLFLKTDLSTLDCIHAANIARGVDPEEKIDKKSLVTIHAEAFLAVDAFYDRASANETEFTGWGDGEVPAKAEWVRIKAQQALRALRDAAVV